MEVQGTPCRSVLSISQIPCTLTRHSRGPTLTLICPATGATDEEKTVVSLPGPILLLADGASLRGMDLKPSVLPGLKFSALSDLIIYN